MPCCGRKKSSLHHHNAGYILFPLGSLSPPWRFVVCLSVCHFVLVFFSPFSIAITSLGEERANLSAFRTFVRVVFVKVCRFPLPLGVWEGLRFLIVALPGLFSYLFFAYEETQSNRVSDFRDFVYSLFPVTTLYDYYFTLP